MKILRWGAVAAGTALFLHWQNNGLEVTRRTATLPRLPSEFDGFRIAQISDLHSKCFGKEQHTLVDAIKGAAPDLIVITGDFIDKRRDMNEDFVPAVTLARQTVKIAPTYYVSGNHEWWDGKFGALCPQLERVGVCVLDNRVELIKRAGAQLALLGLSDPASIPPHNRDATDFHMPQEKRELLRKQLKALCARQEARCRLLLSHRPDLIALYAQAGVDMVFCGHAHGGQVRMPMVGALYAPHQGVLPRYTDGLYRQGNTVMQVSRGLGNSGCPQRIFNRPELVITTLRSPRA